MCSPAEPSVVLTVVIESARGAWDITEDRMVVSDEENILSLLGTVGRPSPLRSIWDSVDVEGDRWKDVTLSRSDNVSMPRPEKLSTGS